MHVSKPNSGERGIPPQSLWAFTLIELLVVIAICHIGGAAAAGAIQGEGESPAGAMHEFREADALGAPDVRAGQ